MADRVRLGSMPDYVVAVHEPPRTPYETALALAEAAPPNCGVHREDEPPPPGALQTFFARDRVDPGCVWCVLDCCWQRVSIYRGGAEVAVHGRRPFLGVDMT